MSAETTNRTLLQILLRVLIDIKYAVGSAVFMLVLFRMLYSKGQVSQGILTKNVLFLRQFGFK